MLTQSHHGRNLFARLAARPVSLQVRCKVTTTKPKVSSMLEATTDVAQQLNQTGVWKGSAGRKKRQATHANEPRRVNIASQSLCDDIIKYIRPSIERHRGCDIIDLNPGAGLWSRALHNVLQPRKHIMMDPDAELYQPFLHDLLEKKNVELIPKSWLLWEDLHEVMRTRLSDQHEMTSADTPSRNDSLLVIANFSMFPKQTFHGFDSISAMALYQFMSSIRTTTLFQKYGLVRMLIWVNDEDKRRLLPRSLNRRKRAAFEAEMSCEWIHEVAGLDSEVQDRYALRDECINTESAYHTLKRMKSAGMVMPAGRRSSAYSRFWSKPKLWGEKLVGVQAPQITRPFKQELEELEHVKESSSRLTALRQRERYEQEDAALYLDLLQSRETIMESAASAPAEFEQANRDWNTRIDHLKKNATNEFSSIMDSYHLFRQTPPALLWDRRAYEPLAVKGEDFFPNAPSALLDMQPRAMHPLFRQYGVTSSRAGEISDVMLRFSFNNPLLSVQEAMAAMEIQYGGSGDLIEKCPSVRDPCRGGSPMTGHGALAVRAMNTEQWTEMLQAWMSWEGRPKYTQMLGRLTEDDDGDVDDEETKSGATGLSF